MLENSICLKALSHTSIVAIYAWWLVADHLRNEPWPVPLTGAYSSLRKARCHTSDHFAGQSTSDGFAGVLHSYHHGLDAPCCVSLLTQSALFLPPCSCCDNSFATLPLCACVPDPRHSFLAHYVLLLEGPLDKGNQTCITIAAEDAW